MFKITALNEVQSKESEEENSNAITKEAQEQFALNEYNRALQLLIENNKTAALNVLLELLDTKLLDEVKKPPKQDGHARPMLSLKYACYKNIANIQADLENYDQALNNYWQAINLDDTDVMIWYKIGSLALNKSYLEEACFAFRQGLKRNENHWPCLDNLITVLYAIPDYMNCLTYISLALEKDPSYKKGLIFCKEILKVVPSFEKLFDDCLQLPVDDKYEQTVANSLIEQAKKLSEDWMTLGKTDNKCLSHLSLQESLETLSWLELGQKIVAMIKHMNENNLNLLSCIVLADSHHLESLVSASCSSKQVENQNGTSHHQDNGFSHANSNGLNHDDQSHSSEFQIRDKINGTDDSPMDSCDESQVKVETNGSAEKMELDGKDEENCINGDCPSNEKVNDRPLENGKADANPNAARESQRQKKVKKRRRSSLCILTEWHWSNSNTKRSSRNTNRKDCEKDGVEETLKRMFPPALLPDNIKFSKEDATKNNDSMDTMDAYYAMLNKENHSPEDSKSTESFKANSPCNEGQSSYFGLEQECLEVRDFIKEYSGKSSIITLTVKLVECLCSKWNQKWPSQLAELYIELYSYVKKYTAQCSPLEDKTDDYLLKLNAQVKLLYCELVLDKWLLDRACTSTEHKSTKEKLAVAILSDDLGYVVFSGIEDDLPDAYLLRRMLWLQANLFLFQGDVEVALRIFELLLLRIQESQVDSMLRLDNCAHNSTISAESVQKTITLIKRSKKFSKIKIFYEDKKYEEVSAILKDTFYFTKQINEFLMYKGEQIDRIEHFKLLLDSLWQLQQYEDCYVWAEACFNEAWHNYLNTIGIDLQSVENDAEKKKWVDCILYTLKMLDDCVSEVSIFVVQYLKESCRSRLVKNLVHIVSHQLETLDSTQSISIMSVLPWILLHYILQYEEDRARARSISRQKNRSDRSLSSESDENEGEIPASMILLFKAHAFLGRHGWCCLEEGRLLIYIIKSIIPKLNFPLYAKIRAKLKEPLEQVVFCLYGHPSKFSNGVKQKPKYLEEHTTQHMPLTWDTCQILLEFYRPETLPTYDTKRVDSISSDTLELFKKMCIHVPKESDSSQEAAKEMSAYLLGNRTSIPQVKLPLAGQVSYLYYFIADYYFKNVGVQSWAKACKYYILDLCQHSDEFNSWAGLAMATSTLMETWLNNFEPNIGEDKYLDKAKLAQKSYQHAVDLEPSHLTIWTEYGNFLYTVHSFCSRLLKQQSDMLNMQRFEILENQKDQMLDKAKHCFSSADNIYNFGQGVDEPIDERWLYHYMLGKIAEKKNEEPAIFLKHYLQANERLFQNNAQYPKRISHSNPPTLAIEALEVYYRIYASILKYLEQHEGKPLKKSLLLMLQDSLNKCLRLPFISYDCTFYKVPADQLVPSTKSRDQSGGRKSSCKRRNDELPTGNDDKLKVARYSDSDLQKDVGSLVDDLIMQVCNRLSPKPTESSEHCAVIKYASSSDMDMKMDVDAQISKLNWTSADDMSKKIAEAMQVPKKCSSNSSNKLDKVLNRRESQESSTTTHTSTSGTNNTSSSSESSSSSDSSSDSSSSSSSDSESASSDTEKKGAGSSIDENGFATEAQVNQLMEMCLAGLEQCILRFPEHYKSVYRLAYFYFNNKTFKNIEVCKQLLLATYECRFHPNQKIQGLFADRKNANFFNGIWRIPNQEIDRPGSFASHMSRCVSFLMQALKDSGDSRMLTELCLQLQKVPEADKKYLRDNEREQLACQALTMCIQCLRNKIKLNNEDKASLYGLNIEAKLQVLLDVYQTYQKVKSVQDYETSLLPQMKKLMEEAYVAYSGNVNAQGNVFDMAKDCCRQQLRLKHKSSATLSNVTAGTPMVVAPASTSSLTVTPLPRAPVGLPRKSTPKTSGPPKPRGRPPTLDKSASASRSNVKSTGSEMQSLLSAYASNAPGTANALMQNAFLAAMLQTNIDTSFINSALMDSSYMSSAMQYLNTYGDVFNKLSNLNYKAPNAKAMNNTATVNVPSEKASTSSNNMFGSIKARPDVSITPVSKNPHQKSGQSATRPKASRVNEGASTSRTSKPTNIMTAPEISVLKASHVQQQQQQQQQRASDHGSLNQVALNILASENKASSSSSNSSRAVIFPPTSQTSITPVKSMPRASQMNAPLQHLTQASITPVTKKPSNLTSQPNTSLQHKLLSSKQHQAYNSSVITSTASRKEDPAKAYYASSSNRKSALGDPNDLSMLSNLSALNPLQAEIFKSLSSSAAYPPKKPSQSSKASKRTLPNVNNAAAFSMKNLTQDIGNPQVGFPHRKSLPDINISSAGYSMKHPSHLVQDSLNITPAYNMKKPVTYTSNVTTAHSSKKNVAQDLHNPYVAKKKAAEAAGFSMKKPTQSLNNLPATMQPLKKPVQDVNNQYSNSVLNRLQQHSHLEIIPQNNQRPRQMESINAPLEVGTLNNPPQPKAMNFLNSDSVSMYELSKQKSNAANSSTSTSRSDKEAQRNKYEIITLDD